MQLGPDRPLRAARRLGDRLEDELGRADEVGRVDHRHHAFGVDQHLDPGVLPAELGDVRRLEHLVDRAMPLPEQDLARDEGLLGVAAQREPGVPERHLAEGDAHGPRGVPAEVLVGEEEDPAAAGERPVEDGPGVRRGADDPAVPAAEGLEVGRRVDVGDGGDLAHVHDRREVGPGGLDGVDVGHVGHAAPGGHVGEDDVDLGAGEDVGGLGHEVDAAEGDPAAVLALGRHPAQLVRVAPEVGEADDLVLLIVVAEDQERVAQIGLRPPNRRLEVAGRQGAVRLEGQGGDRGGGEAGHRRGPEVVKDQRGR